MVVARGRAVGLEALRLPGAPGPPRRWSATNHRRLCLAYTHCSLLL